MPEVEFEETAYKHGLTEKEIVRALNNENKVEKTYKRKGRITKMYDAQITVGDWVEIGYRWEGEKMVVFHAQRK